MYVWTGSDTVKKRRGPKDVYRDMSIPKACGILGIRDREFRESDAEFLRVAFSRKVSLTPNDPTYNYKVKHFYKNHMYIHEAYQFLLKKRMAQIQLEEERQEAEAAKLAAEEAIVAAAAAVEDDEEEEEVGNDSSGENKDGAEKTSERVDIVRDLLEAEEGRKDRVEVIAKEEDATLHKKISEMKVQTKSSFQALEGASSSLTPQSKPRSLLRKRSKKRSQTVVAMPPSPTKTVGQQPRKKSVRKKKMQQKE